MSARARRRDFATMRRSASRWAARFLASAVAAGALAVGIVPPVAMAQEPEAVPPAERQLATRPDRGPTFYTVRSPGGQREDARGAAPLRRRVSVDLHGVSLAQALKALSAQTGIHFVYSQEQVAVGRVVSLEARDITVAAALTELLLDAGVDVQLLPSGQAALVRQTAPGGAEETGSIAGRVTAKDGAALAGATLVVQGTSRSAISGNDGRYRIADVPPGSVTVRARYIGYTPGVVSVTVTADQEATADFALEKSVQKLEDVVTTGTVIPTEIKALPTPITVITAADIEQQHIRRFEEALRLAVPGAVVWEPGAAADLARTSVSLRGTNGLNLGSSPKMYIDGVEVSNSAASPVDPQSIERIEVLRGPQAAAIYGSDAMGGVIQIFTKRGNTLASRPEVEARAALGVIESEFKGSGALRQEYSAAITGMTGGSSYRVGGGYMHTGEWVPDYRNSAPSVNGGLRIAQGPLMVDLSARYYQQTGEDTFHPLLQAAWPALYSTPTHSPWQNQEESYAIRLEYRPRAWWRHSVTAGIDRNSFNYVQTRPRLTTPADTLLFAILNYSRKASVAYNTALMAPLAPGLSANVTAGVDHWLYTSDTPLASGVPAVVGSIQQGPETFFSLDRSRTTNTGTFVQAQVDVREALFLTGAVRGEWNSGFGSDIGVPLSPRFGLTYVRPVGKTTVKLRAAYGEAIRPPDQSMRDGSPGVFSTIQPNPLLRPERQTGPDAGVDLDFGLRGSLSVSYYHQIAKDLIALSTIDAPGFVYKYENLARVRNTGWEFEGVLRARWAVLTGHYAIAHSEPEDLGSATSDTPVGEQMLSVPVHTGAATLTVTPGARTSITAALAYTGEWRGIDWLAYTRCFAGTGPCNGVEISDYVKKFPAFATVNLAAEQRLSRTISGYVGVEDLLNIGEHARSGSNITAVPGRITTVGACVRY